MKKLVNKILIMLAIGVLTFSCNKQTEGLVLTYNIYPQLKDSIPSIKIDFVQKNDENGFIRLKYENDSWGDTNIFNCIKSLKVTPKPEDINFFPDSSLIVIKTNIDGAFNISYEIIQDYEGKPTNQQRYRPMIQPNYFHILGMRLFMIPDNLFESDSTTANIKLHYKGNDTNGLFHSSFGKDKTQNISVNQEDLYASFFVGGDFRRYKFTHQKETVYFITRGEWKMFNDEEVLKILQETIHAQRDFWNDPRKSDFSVSMVPTYESWYSVGGSGFSNSFVSFVSNNDQVTLHQVKWLYNHELLHRWIGRTIVNENEVEQYWFSEGFTDYYAYKLMLKSNQLSVQKFIGILNNEVIVPHYSDPVGNFPNSKLTIEKYWGNYAKFMKLPYRRGLLYAFLIDNQIKVQSNYKNSLDDVMLTLFQNALDNKNMKFNQTIFLETLSQFNKNPNLESDFKRYILDGEFIDLSNHLPEGLSYNTQNVVPVLKLESDQMASLLNQLKF